MKPEAHKRRDHRITKMQACLRQMSEACLTMRKRIPISDEGLKMALWDMAKKCTEAADTNEHP